MREQSASQGATLQDHPLVVLLTNAVKLSWEWLTDVPVQPLISEVQPFGDNFKTRSLPHPYPVCSPQLILLAILAGNSTDTYWL